MLMPALQLHVMTRDHPPQLTDLNLDHVSTMGTPEQHLLGCLLAPDIMPISANVAELTNSTHGEHDMLHTLWETGRMAPIPVPLNSPHIMYIAQQDSCNLFIAAQRLLPALAASAIV